MPKGRVALSLLILASASSASAQDCSLPPPFRHAFANRATAALAAPTPGDPCVLTASLDANASPTSAAFLHYRRPAPATSVRYAFRIDATALGNMTNALRRVQLFSASSPMVLAGQPSPSHVLDIAFMGNGSGSYPVLRIDAAAANSLDVASIPLTHAVNTIRAEIEIGAGDAGYVRYWINAGFADPPTGSLDGGGAGLDNASWIGVIAAELGLSSPSASYRSDYGGAAVVFDQIESNDDLLFWDGFDGVTQ